MFVRLKPSIHIGLLVVIVLIGTFLRLYEIGSIPPGAVYDPAYYGIDALEILEGARPIYLTTNLGREVLFSYLVAFTYKILGPGIVGIRVTAAIVGILTIPAVYLLSRELLADEKDEVRKYGSLAAALVTALSYWHLTWSRFGVRAILVPLFASLAFYCLWFGLRTQRRFAFVLCGLLLGAGLYTYQVARLLPPLALAAFAGYAVSRRSFSRQDAINISLTMGLAGLVFSPLAYYSWTHPGALNERISQVLIFQNSPTWADQWQVIWTQSKSVLRMFSFDGQSDPLEAIPARPLLNPFLSLAFYPGIVISLLRFKNPRYQFLIVWFGVMLAPALISEQGSIAKRGIGALPVVIIFITLGLVVPWQMLASHRHRFRPFWQKSVIKIAALLVLFGFTYTAGVTYRDYFIVWGQDATLFRSQIEHAEIGNYIGGLDSEETVYLSPELASHPVVRLNSGLRPDVRGYSGYHCMVYPLRTAHSTTYVIVPGNNELSLASLETHFPQGKITRKAMLPNDKPLYLAYQIPAHAVLQLTPSYTRQANWSDLIRLTGYELPSTAYSPGDTINLTIYYQALANIEKNYTTYVHLLGEVNPASGSPLWGQIDREPCQGYYPTSRWQAGEIIANYAVLQISAEAPPGEYTLSTGFYSWPEIEPLPLAGPQPGEAAITLQNIQITANSATSE